MEDKKRILKMVEEGKITAEEAIKLLDVLDSNEKCDIVVKEEVIEDDDFFDIKNDGKKGKMLFVRVKSQDGSKVKVNIPLEFIKIMGGIGIMYSS
ncbi:SHOCT-like domain-containing protein [Terrisporobacter glycolicus]|uniref:SHOCT-like domain-containing protein n=1 Tax=Terrisporobacter glycolicus TaxID=36841 RepID=UPI003464DA65